MIAVIHYDPQHFLAEYDFPDEHTYVEVDNTDDGNARFCKCLRDKFRDGYISETRGGWPAVVLCGAGDRNRWAITYVQPEKL